MQEVVTTKSAQFHILLDPRRDYAYLSSLSNPNSYVPDAGLGVIDNPFFFLAGHYKGGITSPSTAPNDDRLFFCWFGSPQGTTNLSPKFSLFCARVLNEEKVGRSASEWLDRPFLVVSWKQISADVINWFNNNYPAGINSNGVGNSFSSSTTGAISTYNSIYLLCNSSYGCIASVIPPGNVTGTPELKQVHLVYDPLDDTVLLYFSIITPNWNPNTKAIYVYKIPVSYLESGTSIDSVASANGGLTPTPSSYPVPNNQPYFVGGVTLDDPNLVQLIAESGAYQWNATNATAVFSAPQFSISFDWMKLTEPYGYQLGKGYLPAIMVAVESPYMINVNQHASEVGMAIPPYYPHGDAIWAFLLQDIHYNPAQPKVFHVPVNTSGGSSPNFYLPYVGYAPATDVHQYGVSIDKFGSIMPMENDGGVVAGYAVPITVPTRQDVNLSSMRMRMLFIEPVWVPNPFVDNLYGASGFGFAVTPDSPVMPQLPTMGLCRPYAFTVNGEVYVTFGGYHYDNYINGVAVKVDPDVFKPSHYKELIGLASNYLAYNSSGTYSAITGPFAMNGRLLTSFGKKYLRVVSNPGGAGSILIVNLYQKTGTASPPLPAQVSFTGVSAGAYGNNVYFPILNSQYSKVFLITNATNGTASTGGLLGPLGVMTSGKIWVKNFVIDTLYYNYMNIAGLLTDD